jgi:hypothetical protein
MVPRKPPQLVSWVINFIVVPASTVRSALTSSTASSMASRAARPMVESYVNSAPSATSRGRAPAAALTSTTKNSDINRSAPIGMFHSTHRLEASCFPGIGGARAPTPPKAAVLALGRVASVLDATGGGIAEPARYTGGREASQSRFLGRVESVGLRHHSPSQSEILGLRGGQDRRRERREAQLLLPPRASYPV